MRGVIRLLPHAPFSLIEHRDNFTFALFKTLHWGSQSVTNRSNGKFLLFWLLAVISWFLYCCLFSLNMLWFSRCHTQWFRPVQVIAPPHSSSRKFGFLQLPHWQEQPILLAERRGLRSLGAPNGRDLEQQLFEMLHYTHDDCQMTREEDIEVRILIYRRSCTRWLRVRTWNNRTLLCNIRNIWDRK